MPASTSPKVFIIGLGWLGEPLARSLLKESFQVAGSTTHAEKQLRLKEDGIPTHLLRFGQEENKNPTDLAEILTAQHVVFTLPPAIKNQQGQGYRNAVDWLCQQLGNSSQLMNLIMTSSTGVYGPESEWCHESTPCKPQRASAQLVLEMEHQLKECFGPRLWVLRLAGLFDTELDGRHPGRFFQQREIPQPMQAVNLVERQDVITTISKILCSNSTPTTLNVASPDHPPRGEFYRYAKMRFAGNVLTCPRWQDGEGKKVDCTKLQDVLGVKCQSLVF